MLRYYIFFLTLLYFPFSLYSQEDKYINVQDFRAIPDDQLDDTEALRNAVAAARNKPNLILYFSTGKYYIFEIAIKIQQDELYGKLRQNTQSKLFSVSL